MTQLVIAKTLTELQGQPKHFFLHFLMTVDWCDKLNVKTLCSFQYKTENIKCTELRNLKSLPVGHFASNKKTKKQKIVSAECKHVQKFLEFPSDGIGDICQDGHTESRADGLTDNAKVISLRLRRGIIIMIIII